MPTPPRLRPHRPAALTSTSLVFGAFAALTMTGWAQPVTPVATAVAQPSFEEWCVIMLGGKQCGFASTITTPIHTPDGLRYQTEQQEEFVVKRLGAPLKLNEISRITEDARGVVLDFTETSTGMGSDTEIHGVREGDDLVVSSHGQTQRYHIPPQAALGPEAIRRLTDAIPLEAGTKFTLNTFITDYPQAVAVEHGQIVGEEPHDVRGKTRNLWKITSRMPVMGEIKSVDWVDDKNNDVETDVTIPGLGEMKQYVTDRAECMKQPEGAEIFAGSLIAPQKALPPLDGQAQAVYRLAITSGTAQKLILWNHDEQRVLQSSPGMSEIEVTVPAWTAHDATYTLPHADTPELDPYLKPSAYLESDSPEIKALAKEALGGETNPVLAAARIQNFVERYITKKDLNVGFASAEDTAKSREGDCTEHAVLCAAIGRAAGLPTRCVLGLGYIPPGEIEPTISNAVDTKTGIFGFHMWAEAWIGPGRWVAMDAALGSFDIGHIAIVKSALDDIDPLVDLNMPILQLMQNLKITVLKTVSKQDFSAPPMLAPTSVGPRLTVPAALLPTATKKKHRPARDVPNPESHID
jgi:hypothetical protein